MKCPKCGYFGPDSLNICKKCGKELFSEKAKLGLSSSPIRSFRPRPIPQKPPPPKSLTPKTPGTATPLQDKTSPLFMNELPALSAVSPSMQPKIEKQDFLTEAFDLKFEEQAKKSGKNLTALGEDTQDIKMSRGGVQDFEFPDDLSKTPPPLSALSSNEELFILDDDQEQEQIDFSSINREPLYKNEAAKDGNKKLLHSDVPQKENRSPDCSAGEAPPAGMQTELIDRDELAEIFLDIGLGPSGPDRTT